jgi:hypothetical protein
MYLAPQVSDFNERRYIAQALRKLLWSAVACHRFESGSELPHFKGSAKFSVFVPTCSKIAPEHSKQRSGTHFTEIHQERPDWKWACSASIVKEKDNAKRIRRQDSEN